MNYLKIVKEDTQINIPSFKLSSLIELCKIVYKNADIDMDKFFDYQQCVFASILLEGRCYIYFNCDDYKKMFLYEIAYDFKDADGNRVLPFTKQQPLMTYNIHYSKSFHYLEYMGLDFSKVSSFTAGMFSFDIYRDDELYRKTYLYNFPKYQVINKDNYLELREPKFPLFLTKKWKNSKKITNIRNRLNILEKSMNEI